MCHLSIYQVRVQSVVTNLAACAPASVSSPYANTATIMLSIGIRGIRVIRVIPVINVPSPFANTATIMLSIGMRVSIVVNVSFPFSPTLPPTSLVLVFLKFIYFSFVYSTKSKNAGVSSLVICAFYGWFVSSR
jgi:hypothetical protein